MPSQTKPGPQVVPQPPQFCRSTPGSTQRPAHSMSPAWQLRSQRPAPSHKKPDSQGLSQAPQWSWSLRTSTQCPAHGTKPREQADTQAPSRQTNPAVQLLTASQLESTSSDASKTSDLEGASSHAAQRARARARIWRRRRTRSHTRTSTSPSALPSTAPSRSERDEWLRAIHSLPARIKSLRRGPGSVSYCEPDARTPGSEQAGTRS